MARKKRSNDGQTRPSRLVNRRILPGVEERETLNRLLRAHDPEVAAENLSKISAAHAPLLRQIALEGQQAGGDPAVRKHAIALLGRFAAPEDLNALVGLAQFDADTGVRAAALVSLGTSGVQLAAPILAAALASDDTVEATAGAKALHALADRIGADVTLASISPGGGARVSRLVKQAFEARAIQARGRKRSATRAD
jgi:HEAT repeats